MISFKDSKIATQFRMFQKVTPQICVLPHFETTFDKLTNFWLCEKLSALVALTASCRILQEKIGGTLRCGSGSLWGGREHFQSSLLPCWEPWNIWDLGCWDSPTSGSGCSWRFFHFRRWKSRTPHWSIWWSCGFLRRFQWRHLPLHLDDSKRTKQLSSNIFGEAPNQWLYSEKFSFSVVMTGPKRTVYR